ncbi:MAG: hypothetical protein LBM75_04430 [Myxococcales bacterium]|jgi:hypothetical protein|nr:hypothetical protein [Myxococcales bacterium]
MKRFFGTMAMVAVLGISGVALANNQANKNNQGAAMSGHQSAQKALTIEGKVLKVERDHLILDYRGAAVQFKVSRDTQIQGVTSVRNLTEGQQVRASFEMRDNENELKTITLMPSSTYPSSPESSPSSR